MARRTLPCNSEVRTRGGGPSVCKTRASGFREYSSGHVPRDDCPRCASESCPRLPSLGATAVVRCPQLREGHTANELQPLRSESQKGNIKLTVTQSSQLRKLVHGSQKNTCSPAANRQCFLSPPSSPFSFFHGQPEVFSLPPSLLSLSLSLLMSRA